MLHQTTKIMLEKSVEDTVRSLLPEVPEDAHGVFVAIHASSLLLNINDVTVEIDGRVLPVSYYPILPDRPEYLIWIGYGQGILE